MFFSQYTHCKRSFDEVKIENGETPPTIKSYSTTRWNGVSTVSKSVLHNKDLIGTFLSSQKMCDPKDRLFDMKPTSKASNII